MDDVVDADGQGLRIGSKQVGIPLLKEGLDVLNTHPESRALGSGVEGSGVFGVFWYDCGH